MQFNITQQQNEADRDGCDNNKIKILKYPKPSFDHELSY